MCIIPIPTYLLDDAELIALRNKLIEIDMEADQPDARTENCLTAIEAELERRGAVFTLRG